MNLGEFKAFVKADLKRGSSLDALIPARAQMAARFLERNWTFQYMKVFVNVVLNPSDPNPKLVEFPHSIKSTPWLRTAKDDEYTYLKLLDPRDLLRSGTGPPSAYWRSGRANIVLDRVPDQAYVIEGQLVFYTSWPTDDEAQPWLLENGSDVVLGQTMMFFAAYLRDNAMFGLYKGLRDEGVRTMLLADQEEQWDGAGMEIGYTPFNGLVPTEERR